jgi:hypothetical protein
MKNGNFLRVWAAPYPWVRVIIKKKGDAFTRGNQVPGTFDEPSCTRASPQRIRKTRVIKGRGRRGLDLACLVVSLCRVAVRAFNVHPQQHTLERDFKFGRWPLVT